MNRFITSSIPVVCIAWFALLTVAHTGAQTVPPLINYQGKLVSSNGLPVSTGDYELRFRIYDAATAGNLVWGPQVFNGQTGPGFGPKVPVVQGWFNVMLGPVDTNGVSIATAFLGTNRFMETQLGTSAPFSPRQQILSAPYAIGAERLQGYQWSDFFTSGNPANAQAKSALLASQAISVPSLTTTNALQLFVSINGNDANNGLTLATAKRTVQAAIDAVPLFVQHPVDIQVYPGTYPETLQIFKMVSLGTGNSRNSAWGYLTIKGMGTVPGEVTLTGAYARRTSVNILNLSFRGASVWIDYSSVLNLASCRFPANAQDALVIQNGSIATVEDCSFEGTGTSGREAIVVQWNSLLCFWDDYGFADGADGIPGRIGDPQNLLHNTISNYAVGIWVMASRFVRVRNSPVGYVNVPTQVQLTDGGTAP